MKRSNTTYLGWHWDKLLPFPVAELSSADDPRIDADHRIKVYQYIGEDTLLYAPQFRLPNAVRWHYYMEMKNVGCNDGSWDSWATFSREAAIRKCTFGVKETDQGEPGLDGEGAYEYRNGEEEERNSNGNG